MQEEAPTSAIGPSPSPTGMRSGAALPTEVVGGARGQRMGSESAGNRKQKYRSLWQRAAARFPRTVAARGFCVWGARLKACIWMLQKRCMTIDHL